MNTPTALSLAQAATYDGWNQAMAKLRNAAETLGLEIVGWGAIPSNPPKIKVDEDGTWTCPHCKAKEDVLEVVEAGDYATMADWVDDHWSPSLSFAETDTIGYYCLNCNGWVTPEDELIWS